MEKYILKLKEKEYTNNYGSDSNTQADIQYWKNLVRSICTVNQRHFVVLKFEIPQMALDREKSSVVLQNIVTNAIEHSLPHTKIIVSFENIDDQYKISIKDEGTGFDKDSLNNATKNYFSTKNSSKGTNDLGLFIVSEIMKENNGFLTIENYSDSNSSGAIVNMLFRDTGN